MVAISNGPGMRGKDALLQVVGARPAGLGLGINILPDGDPRGEPGFSGGLHGFQSYPLAIAPRIIDKINAYMTLGAYA